MEALVAFGCRRYTSQIMKALQKIKEFFENEQQEISVQFDEDHLYYMWDEIIKGQFSWNSVLEIFAFKRDMLAVDLICIGFRINDDCEYFEIDEEMDGYKEAVKFLSKRFKGINKSWFTDVAFPPFKTNLVSLWGVPLIKKNWEV